MTNDSLLMNPLPIKCKIKSYRNHLLRIFRKRTTYVLVKMLQCISIILMLQISSLETFDVLMNDIFRYHNETAEKTIFAKEVVRKIQDCFDKSWFFTIIFCEFTYFENRIVKYTETYNNGYPVLLLSSCPSKDNFRIKPKLDTQGETSYIVSSSELSLDNNEFVISALVRTGVWKPRSPVIFVLNVPVTVDSYFYYAMKRHFQLLYSRRITNSALLIWADKIRLYLYNPFYEEVREITDMRNLTRLLAMQYDNLNGKPLRVTMFRKIYITNETGPVTCDTQITKSIVDYLNATCEPVEPRDGKTVGEFYDNGTSTGATLDLIEGFTDMEGKSRILQNSYFGYIDTTYPLNQDELCFLVKKAGKQSSFTTTIQLMKDDVLSIMAGVFFLLIVIGTVAYNVERKMGLLGATDTSSETIFNLIRCFIRQTVDFKFLGPVFRLVVIIIMLYSLVIDCVIDGILTTSITYPRWKPDINTLDELYNSNLILAIHSRHLTMFRQTLAPNYEEFLRTPIEAFNDKKIQYAIENRQYQYAILLRKSDAQYISRKISNTEKGKPLFHTVTECPLPCFIVYGLQYGSPYLPQVDGILMHLNEAGISNHWSQMKDQLGYKSQTKSPYLDDTKEKRPLNMDNLREVFYVWFIGLSISVMSFTLEIILHRFHRTLILI